MSTVARNLGLFAVCLLVIAGCSAERRAPRPFDDGGTATGCIGCADSTGSAGFGNAITGTAGTGASALAGSGSATDTGSAGAGSSGAEFGEAGSLGAGSAGTGDTAGAADAGATDPFSSGPCPAGFECVADPLIGMLHACLKSGPLPLPVECMTDTDCHTAGLPKGTCITEEETGLTGCLQLCSPPATPAADGGM